MEIKTKYQHYDQIVADTLGRIIEATAQYPNIVLADFDPCDPAHLYLAHAAFYAAQLSHKPFLINANPIKYWFWKRTDNWARDFVKYAWKPNGLITDTFLDGLKDLDPILGGSTMIFGAIYNEYYRVFETAKKPEKGTEQE